MHLVSCLAKSILEISQMFQKSEYLAHPLLEHILGKLFEYPAAVCEESNIRYNGCLQSYAPLPAI